MPQARASRRRGVALPHPPAHDARRVGREHHDVGRGSGRRFRGGGGRLEIRYKHQRGGHRHRGVRVKASRHSAPQGFETGNSRDELGPGGATSVPKRKRTRSRVYQWKVEGSDGSAGTAGVESITKSRANDGFVPCL